MDNKLDQSTEERILKSATAIFFREGYAGARMQAIADHAGINKALLHYYFRSKDKLFLKVFSNKFQMLMPKIQLILNDQMDIFDKIDRIVDTYVDMLTENPYLPALVLCTVNHHPEFLKELPVNIGPGLLAMFEQEAKKGTIKPMPAAQFFMSLLGLCIMPYLAKPMFSHIMGLDEKAYQYLLEQRRALIKQIARDMLRV